MPYRARKDYKPLSTQRDCSQRTWFLRHHYPNIQTGPSNRGTQVPQTYCKRNCKGNSTFTDHKHKWNLSPWQKLHHEHKQVNDEKTEGSASCPSQKFNIGSFTSLANSSCFSTAIALGSSAIVQVSGRNCFGTLYGSLSQIYLGKVPPRFSTQVSARVHHGSTRALQVSSCLWFSALDPFWVAKRFSLNRFCGRKVHQGSSRLFQGPRFLHHFFPDVSQILNSFCIFP